MKNRGSNTILARRASGEFVGRDSEVERLVSHARSGSGGLAILAEPSAGTSEILLQTYDRLFAEQTEVIPFYFEVKDSDPTKFECLCRLAREFLTQAVAFRRRDPSIIANLPSLDEIARLALPDDFTWVDGVIETIRSVDERSACSSSLRSLLSAPLRPDIPVFVMLDGLERTAPMTGLLEEIAATFSMAGKTFVLAGHRRFLFARTELPPMQVDRLDRALLANAVSTIATAHRVEINDASRDLIAAQLRGDLHLIRHLFAAAAASGAAFDSFENVERTYTDEIFGGRIDRHFDAILGRCSSDAEKRAGIVKLLADGFGISNAPVPLTYWGRDREVGAEMPAVLQELNSHELIDLFPGSARLNDANPAFHDYLAARSKLAAPRSRAQAVGEILAANLKRAPQILAKVYRREAAIGLKGILGNFGGQSVSSAALDYGRFSSELKGADREHIRQVLSADDSKIVLPNIVYTASTVDYYPKLSGLIEAERTTIGTGFAGEKKERVTWIAAEIDSKLEANKELTEFWCDRLEMVAHSCDLPSCTIWLVAPEGFSPDAVEVLRERNAFGSSRAQVEILRELLGAVSERTAQPEARPANEYEFVIPMGADTELIAARAIEDVARRHRIPQKATNQIKTALVEACINASEHSLSPDAKISLKAAVHEDRIVITIANRGIRLADKKQPAVSDDNRRGWGLKLIEKLMDDVVLNETDDGTVITMTKLIKPA